MLSDRHADLYREVRRKTVNYFDLKKSGVAKLW